MSPKRGPKARKDATTIPGGSNLLAVAVADRLKTSREERSLDEATAAKQCGLTGPRWKMFESGRAIPTYDEIERICRWAFEGINFWSYPLAKEKQKRQISKGDGWKTHKYNVPKETDIRIARASNRLGISISALTHLAIEHFLEKENIISTFEEAARRIERARIVDRVNEDPYLASFLSGDIDIVVSMGAKLVAPPKETRQSPAERLLERFHAEEDNEWEVLS